MALSWDRVAPHLHVRRATELVPQDRHDSKSGKRVVVADEVMALLGEIAAAKGNPAPCQRRRPGGGVTGIALGRAVVLAPRS